MFMNIYHVVRTDKVTWDEYSASVVYAKSTKRALGITSWITFWKEDGQGKQGDKVDIIYLGKAKTGAKEGEILADYNAG